MSEKKEYPKKLLTIDAQIDQLKERGMIIENLENAKCILKNISYFRLAGFWWEYQINKVDHKFAEGVTIELIFELCKFDRDLRIILFDALERIEVAIRSKMVYYLSMEAGLWWFENPNIFYSRDYFEETLKDIDRDLERSKEAFLQAHYDKYGTEQRPPAYKTMEVVSFGCLSKIYSNLDNSVKAKERIAIELNLPKDNYLKSWLMAFNTVRNIVAHHSRIWNRNIDLPPKSLHKTPHPFINIPNNVFSIYHTMSCMIFVLNKIDPTHDVKDKIKLLLSSCPKINITEMGFPENWKEQPLWK